MPEKAEDVALEAAVTKEFCKYGVLFIKMRRDMHHMPYAFVTFTVSQSSELRAAHANHLPDTR